MISFMLNTVFFFSGFIALIAQTILLREMLVVFQGNELSIGLILSHWLLGVAFGSLTAGQIKKNNAKIMGGSFIGIGVYLPAAFYVVRSLRQILHLFPGEGIPLLTLIGSSFLILLPLSFLTGTQFSLGVRCAEKASSRPSAKIYFLESLGYLFGGIMFTYIFLVSLNSSQIILIQVLLCLISAILLLSAGTIRMILGVVITGLIVFLPKTADYMEKRSINNLYSGYDIIEVINTPYGQAAVVEREKEKYLFYNGIPVFSFPDPEIEKAEEFGYLSLLFHREPEKVLLIGGAGKYINEILNYGVRHLDYAEIDPYLVKLREKYWSQGLNDHRLSVHYSDGRKFLRQSKEKYEAILIAVPYPVNLSLNRYFTAEFFSLIKENLRPDGIVSLTFPETGVYADRNILQLLSSIGSAIRQTIPYIKMVPGDTTLLLACSQPFAETGEIRNRFLNRGLKTKFISDKYIDYRFEQGKENRLKEQVDIISKPYTYSNRDFVPGALLYSLEYWQSIFAPKTVKVYKSFIKYSWVLWIIAGLFFIYGKTGFGGMAFTTGVSAMGLQMLSIWGLQVFCGSIYHWIGLLTAVFMAGIALGSYFRYSDSPKTLLIMEILFCLWTAAWWMLIKNSLIVWQMFFIFSAGSGFLLGAEFSLIISACSNVTKSRESVFSSKIYAADLLGGWMSAILGGMILIPAWGFEKTILLILALKLISLRWWAKSSGGYGC